MDVHPVLSALRADDGPQRRAQAELAGLLAGWQDANRAVLSAFDAYAAGAALDSCPALAALFAPGPPAGRLAAGLVATMAQGLGTAPLGHVPLRHSCNRAIATLVLARGVLATLSLVAFDGAGLAQQPPARTADFGPSAIRDHVLSGTAEAEFIRCTPRPGGATLERQRLTIGAGTVIARDGEAEALHLLSSTGALVVLRLQRRAAAGVPPEYDLADGRLVHQAAGNPRDSRSELLLALLGRKGRTDAAPLAARIALGQGGDGLRWQALRECLALDTARGFAALCNIAARPDDPLSSSAGALRARLIETHPQLERLVPCPA